MHDLKLSDENRRYLIHSAKHKTFAHQVVWWRSASCFSVLRWLNAISPLASWSHKKWCLMSMCLVLEWFTGLFASLIALSLSHKSRILLNLQPKSLKVNRIQSSCAQQVPAATYSALAVDRATEFYFLELQDTKDRPRNWQVPELLFWPA